MIIMMILIYIRLSFVIILIFFGDHTNEFDDHNDGSGRFGLSTARKCENLNLQSCLFHGYIH